MCVRVSAFLRQSLAPPHIHVSFSHILSRPLTLAHSLTHSQLVYVVFDILYDEHESLINLPLRERQRRLAQAVQCLPASEPGLPLGSGARAQGGMCCVLCVLCAVRSRLRALRTACCVVRAACCACCVMCTLEALCAARCVLCGARICALRTASAGCRRCRRQHQVAAPALQAPSKAASWCCCQTCPCRCRCWGPQHSRTTPLQLQPQPQPQPHRLPERAPAAATQNHQGARCRALARAGAGAHSPGHRLSAGPR